MRTARALALPVAAAFAVLVLSGCGPLPAEGESSAPAAESPSSTVPTQAPSASASADPTTAAPAAELPGACDDIYSDAMLATLNAEQPPLNDPGLTLLSTENVDAVEVLGRVPSLRCTWGTAGESGLATTVAVVSDADAAAVQASLEAQGVACGAADGGTLCEWSQRILDQDDQERELGESHWFGDGFWVATHWITYNPTGYTADIAATLAGG